MPMVFPLLLERHEEEPNQEETKDEETNQETDIFLGREGVSTLPVPPLETKKSALF